MIRGKVRRGGIGTKLTEIGMVFSLETVRTEQGVTQSQLVKEGDYRAVDFLVRRRRAQKMPAPRISRGIAPGSGMATTRL